MMSLAVNPVAYAAAVTSVGLTSLMVLSRLGLKGPVESVLAVAVLTCSQIVVAVEVLSLAGAITAANLLACHLVVMVALLILGLRPGSPLRSLSARGVREAFLSTRRPLQALSIVVFAGAVVLCFVTLLVPPNNHDGLSYHMSRVGFYAQQESLDAFETADIRQTLFPANAEILILWQVVLLGSDRTAGLVQWLSWCGSMLAIYGLARQIGFARDGALFAALAFGCFPAVVLQASSTQNDLLSAFFVLISFLFLGESGSSVGRTSRLLLAGLAFGLAVGTKSLALLMIPGLGLYALAARAERGRVRWSELVQAGVLAIAGVAVLGSYFYAQNIRRYGHPTGPAAFRDLVSLPGFDPEVAWSNLGRLVVRFLDPGGSVPPQGIWIAPMVRGYTLSSESAFRLLRVRKQLRESDFMYFGWPEFDALRVHEDFSMFGPLFALLGLPLLFIIMVRPPPAVSAARARTMACGAIVYLLLIASLLRWQQYHGRLLVSMAAVAAPLLAALFASQRRRSAVIWNVGLATVSAAGLIVCCLYNERKPLVGPSAIWGKDRLERMALGNPSLVTLIRFLDTLPLNGSRLGVVPQTQSELIYPFFGEGLVRDVITVRIDGEADLTPSSLPPVDYVLFLSESQAFFLEGAAALREWPWFGRVDLRPLIHAIRQPGSGWRPIIDVDGFAHLFAWHTVPPVSTERLPEYLYSQPSTQASATWWADNWVGPRFRVLVRLDAARSALLVEGYVPAVGSQRPSIAVLGPDQQVLKRIYTVSAGPFQSEIPLRALAATSSGSYVPLEFVSQIVFNPKKLGLSNDTRDLSWQLREIRLVAAGAEEPIGDFRGASQWWSDKWVARSFSVDVCVDPARPVLKVGGEVPGMVKEELSLRVTSRERLLAELRLSPGPFNALVSLQGLAESPECVPLQFDSDFSFNPKRLGQSADARDLSWRLYELSLEAGKTGPPVEAQHRP